MLEEMRQQRRQQRRQKPLRRPHPLRRPNADERRHSRLRESRQDYLSAISAEQPQARLASASRAYHEHCVEAALASDAEGSTDPFANGQSVLVVPSFATPAECYTFMDAADAVLKFRRHTLTGEGEVFDHVYARNLVRLNVAHRLDAASCDVSKAFVARALSLLEAQLPNAAAAIFKLGPFAPLTSRLQLTFSPNEPAVNVYTPGGDFSQHEDKKALTILVPLSDASTYEGGGTGFYRGGAAGRVLRREAHEEADAASGAEPLGEPPSLMLRPVAVGSAILFGGSVTHAALPVVAGTRFVWVASFSAAHVRPKADSVQSDVT